VDYTAEDISPKDNSLGDCSPEDYLPGVASFDQFSQIAFNNADKARVTTPYYRRSIL